MNYAVEQKADIISMSLGGPADVPELKEAVDKRRQRAECSSSAPPETKATATTVQRSTHIPAAYNEVIAVGSVSLTRESSEFSNANKEIDLGCTRRRNPVNIAGPGNTGS
jgi:major intracellular serine protease